MTLLDDLGLSNGVQDSEVSSISSSVPPVHHGLQAPLSSQGQQDQIQLLEALTGTFGTISGLLIFLVIYVCFKFRQPLWAFLSGYFGCRLINPTVEVRLDCTVRLNGQVASQLEMGWTNQTRDVETGLREIDVLQVEQLPAREAFYECSE